MKILVAGATGATGRLLTRRLLDAGHQVVVIVRAAERLPDDVRSHSAITIFEGTVLDLSSAQLADALRDCDAVACCLGHAVSFKGLFGPPRRLVRDSVARLCAAIEENAPERPVRLVLMNTAGNSNRDLDEPLPLAHRFVVGVLRVLIPPHADNEQAADHLRVRIGPDHQRIEWAAVRPDGLINQDIVSEYDLHPSPTRSAILDPGKTSRINVADFMARLIEDAGLWNEWKGRMPVIYNRG